MKNLSELKDALLTIKNYCTDRACKKCGLSSNDSCILTLSTPQDWTILDKPLIKLIENE